MFVLKKKQRRYAFLRHKGLNRLTKKYYILDYYKKLRNSFIYSLKSKVYNIIDKKYTFRIPKKKYNLFFKKIILNNVLKFNFFFNNNKFNQIKTS